MAERQGGSRLTAALADLARCQAYFDSFRMGLGLGVAHCKACMPSNQYTHLVPEATLTEAS